MKFALFALLPAVLALPALNKRHDDDYSSGHHSIDSDSYPFAYTSTLKVWATPDTIIGATGASVPGLPGATGLYQFGINSDYEFICYNITFYNFPEQSALNYSSPARTATHIHEAVAGKAGPPRIAFPNAAYNSNGQLVSFGCLTGPFETGVLANGTDTGSGFSLKEIEADPSQFFADVHLGGAYTAGAVRGQLYRTSEEGNDYSDDDHYD